MVLVMGWAWTRRRWGGGRLLAVSELFAALTLPRHAIAGEFAVDVRCPALSAEVEAELEARVRVDLSLRSADGGALDIICLDREARVIWHPIPRGAFTRTVALDNRRLVDALLVAVADLAQESAAAVRAESVLEPVAPVVASALVAPASRYKTSGEQAATAPPALSSWPVWLGVSLGGTASMFSSGQGSTGPNLGVLLGLPSSLVVGIHGEYGFALGSSDAVRIRTWGGAVSLSRWIGDKNEFEIGTGVSAGSVETFVSAPLFGDSGAPAVYFAALVRARYAVQNGAWRIGLGPELRFYTAPVTVSVDGVPVWKLPMLAAGLTLDMSTRLYGDLW